MECVAVQLTPNFVINSVVHWLVLWSYIIVLKENVFTKCTRVNPANRGL
jgi:hypothetical protein